MPLIASSLPGRIRIRHKSLAKSSHAARLREVFLSLEGITQVEAKPDSASLVICYDAAAIPVEAMESAVDEIVLAELEAAHLKKNRTAKLNRIAKYGMLLSLSISLALAAGGSRRAHALTGGLCLAFMGLHLYHHRNRLTA